MATGDQRGGSASSLNVVGRAVIADSGHAAAGAGWVVRRRLRATCSGCGKQHRQGASSSSLEFLPYECFHPRDRLRRDAPRRYMASGEQTLRRLRKVAPRGAFSNDGGAFQRPKRQRSAHRVFVISDNRRRMGRPMQNVASVSDRYDVMGFGMRQPLMNA
jgi:hypothetical protein